MTVRSPRTALPPAGARAPRVPLPAAGAGTSALLALALAGQALRAGRRAGRLSVPVGYRVEADFAPPGGAVTAPAITLAAVGDSAVAGVGAPAADQSLAVLVAEHVVARLQRGVHVVGYGVSGARTADVRLRQVASVGATGADVVLVVVGTNDVLHLTPPPVFAQQTRALLEELRAATGAPVVVCSLPEFRSVSAMPQPLRGLAVAYGSCLGVLQRAAVAEVPGTVFVDVKAAAGGLFVSRPELFSADGLHPSPLGYAVMAEVLADGVTTALGSSPAPRTPGPPLDRPARRSPPRG